MFEMTEMYRELGISEKVYQFGKEIEKSLEDRFDQIDKVTEFNQLKVIRAMQESRVNEACFHYASGYGYKSISAAQKGYGYKCRNLTKYGEIKHSSKPKTNIPVSQSRQLSFGDF